MYDENYQKMLINLIISDSSIFTRVKPILKPEYFDKKFQATINYLNDFTAQYNTLPTLLQLNTEARTEYQQIDGIKENINLQKSILNDVEKYCKEKALGLAIEECYRRLSNGDTSSIDKIIKEAQSVSLQKDLGINYWENVEEWLHKLDVEMGVLPTGWQTIDDCLNGGFSWGQLNYVVAPSGGGKSIFLSNMAINWSLMGYNVIYFTMELDKELVGKRILAIQQDVAYRDISSNIAGYATKVNLDRINKKPGSVQIIDMPRAITPNDLISCIQNYEIEKNIIPQTIVVDYSGIMSPSDRRVDVNNIHLRDKAIAEELREIARERTHNNKNTMVISAAQITKDAASEMEFTQSDVAGGSVLVHTCDNLFSVRTNDSMKQRGEYEFKFIKCRNSGATDKKIKMGYNVNTLRIFDTNDGKNNPLTGGNLSTDTSNSNNLTSALATLQAIATK